MSSFDTMLSVPTCEPVTESVSVPLSDAERAELAVHEATIQRGMHSLGEVGAALLAIREKRLYREAYGTFEVYCQERWRMSRPHAYRLMEAATVVQNVSHGRQTLAPLSERQVRPLARLEPEAQREVWDEAVRTAPNGKPTARHVEETVRRYREVPQEDGGSMVVLRERLPSWTLLAGRHTLAAAFCFDSHGPITTAIRNGDLPVIEAEWQGRREVFVVCGAWNGRPSDALHAFMQREPWQEPIERYVDLLDIHRSQERMRIGLQQPNYSVSHVAAAYAQQQLAGRVREGRLEIYVAWEFVRWVLQTRPRTETEAILKAQVIS